MPDAVASPESSPSTGQDRVLAMARAGTPLGELMAELVRTAEALSEGGFFASILLADPAGESLLLGAAPSLPAAYHEAIDGIAVGPCVGSCGTAAYFGHSIVVTDIERDPLWAEFREVALRHGLRACWSTPLLARDGSVLGTLALHYREPRGPTERERRLVRQLAHTATIVVDSERLSGWLRGIEHPPLVALENARTGVFTWDVGADHVVWHNHRPYEIFGLTEMEGPINAHRFVSEFLHPHDQERFARAVDSTLDRGEPFLFEGRIRRKSDGAPRQVRLQGRLLDAALRAIGPCIVGIADDVTSGS